MAADELTVDEAWQALCDVREGLRTNAPSAAAAGPLRINGDGSWSASGPVSAPARELLDSLCPLVAHHGRLAIAQLGQSLDGRIATESGHSKYVNGPESLVHLHRLRALMDAVVVGANTATEDDPRLTVRHVAGPQPVRVLLDPWGRVPGDIALLQSSQAPTLHVTDPDARPATNAGAHVRRLTLKADASGFQPSAVLDLLAQQGLERVLVEGGGITVSRFVEAGVLDRLHLLVAPLLIGSGRPGLCTTPIETLDDALRPRARCFACGNDTLFDLVLD